MTAGRDVQVATPVRAITAVLATDGLQSRGYSGPIRRFGE